ncbi:MAG: hypothetical protein ACQKBV_13765, partial [Puniceicoccales bacterium]
MSNPTTQPLARQPMFLRVIRVLKTVRRRYVSACWLNGTGRALTFLFGVILVRCALDYFLHFDWSARVALLLVDVGIIGWILWRFLWRPLNPRMTLLGAALRLQHAAPQLRSSVVATLELAPKADAGQASRSLVQRLLQQTVQKLGSVDFADAVSLRGPVKWFGSAVVLALALVGWAVTNPVPAKTLIGRYFLSQQAPLYRTQLEVVSGDMTVARGARVQMEVVATGEMPREATFILSANQEASGRFTVTASEDEPGRFVYYFDNARENFRYRVEAGDARSRTYEIEVMEPPELRELTATIYPPQYTGMEPYEVPATNLDL